MYQKSSSLSHQFDCEFIFGLMFTIFKRELFQLLSSFTGALIVSIFLLVNGLFLWVVPINEYLNIPASGYATLDPLFTLAPWMYLILIPALTMKTISEEKSNGTIELIKTKPIKLWHFVTGKFMACSTVLLLSLLPTALYGFSVHQLAYPVGNIDTGGIMGSYIGLFLLGLLMVAIGVFGSALAKNQIVSLMISICLCVVFYFGFDWIAAFAVESKLSNIVAKIGIQDHYFSLSRGLVDTRDIVYFLAFTGLFIGITSIKLNSEKG